MSIVLFSYSNSDAHASQIPGSPAAVTQEQLKDHHQYICMHHILYDTNSMMSKLVDVILHALLQNYFKNKILFILKRVIKNVGTYLFKDEDSPLVS